MKEIVQYDPPRSYARASRVGNLICLAGETGELSDATKHVEGDIVQQTEAVFENIRGSLALFGASFDDLVRMDVFLVNREHRKPFMDVLRRYMPGGAPPGAMVCVKELLHEGMLVEVEVIAAAPEKQEV